MLFWAEGIARENRLQHEEADHCKDREDAGMTKTLTRMLPADPFTTPLSDGQLWHIRRLRKSVFGSTSVAYAVFYATMREAIGVDCEVEQLTRQQASDLITALRKLPPKGQGVLGF